MLFRSVELATTQARAVLPAMVPLADAAFNIGHAALVVRAFALSGYGGIKHCLIPSPQHVIVDRDENGELFHWKLSDHQDADSMLKLLGY